MRRVNGTFRQLDKATDVLSFPGDLVPSTDPSRRDVPLAAERAMHPFDTKHLGDVVVAVPTARRQAEQLGHSPTIELRILLLHGVLHCLGHDHETDDGTMERLEQRLRLRYIADE